jgi:hypothetical protein
MRPSALEGKAQLLDALFTKSTAPFARSSFPEYTPEIGQDIKAIVRLMPQSMNSISGGSSFVDEFPILWAAISNVNIPLSTIEFLIQQQSTPNALGVFNETCNWFFQNLDVELSREGVEAKVVERFLALRDLLVSHGLVNPKAPA